MAITLDETIGGAASNTYVTLAEAITYFEGRLHDDDWTTASVDTQNQALANATKRLEEEEYDGLRADTTFEAQALKWPRKFIFNQDGVAIPDNAMPREMKIAEFELALAMIQSDIQKNSTLKTFDRIKVDVIELDINKTNVSSTPLPSEVQRIISIFQTTVSKGMSGITSRA
jgi:hypothetical protein